MIRRLFDRDQLVLRVPHLLLSHAGQLTETVAGGHAFHEVLVALVIEHEVDRRLIDREDTRHVHLYGDRGAGDER